jgi:hypothetical protein
MSALRQLSKRLGKLDRVRSEAQGSGDDALLLTEPPRVGDNSASGGVV